MRPDIKELIERKFEFRCHFYDEPKDVYLYMVGFLSALQEVGLITLPEWDKAIKDLTEWKEGK